jgi:hypothetical protein
MRHPMLANAEALLDPTVHIVVTGQQPGSLGGPLFTCSKVATAIRSRATSTPNPAVRASCRCSGTTATITTSDEANRFFMVNQRTNCSASGSTCSGPRAAAHDRSRARRQKLLAEIDPLLPQSEHRAWAVVCQAAPTG